MTLDDLAASLPNAFHDAQVYTITIDYARREARLDLDIWVGNLDAKDYEQRESYRRAEVTLTGLVFWVSEPPDPRYPYQENDSLTIDMGAMHALAKTVSTKLPPVPNGAFVNWIFVNEWNSFIYLAAQDAQLTWHLR